MGRPSPSSRVWVVKYSHQGWEAVSNQILPVSTLNTYLSVALNSACVVGVDLKVRSGDNEPRGLTLEMKSSISSSSGVEENYLIPEWKPLGRYYSRWAKNQCLAETIKTDWARGVRSIIRTDERSGNLSDPLSPKQDPKSFSYRIG